jgi:hypothetical protein
MDPIQEQIGSIIRSGSKNFRNGKFPGGDFSRQKLRGADFRGATLMGAKFVETDLTYVNFEGANLTEADFTEAVCHRTNFKDAKLCYAKMMAKDLFGSTFTLECKSFEGMQTKPGWWAGWLMYGLLMKPPSPEHREKLILAMGVEYWEVLRRQYQLRQL